MYKEIYQIITKDIFENLIYAKEKNEQKKREEIKLKIKKGENKN